MNKIKVLILVLSFFFIAGYAQAESIWFSPLTAIPEDPTGTRSSVLEVNTYGEYGDALAVTANGPVTEINPRWLVLGLTAQDKKAIKGVKVCYQVVTDTPGSTYIAQVRLTSMTTPDISHVINDDGTDLTSTTPKCYTSYMPKHKPKVDGTTTLSLKMVFGSTDDIILIGGVQLIF